MGFLDFLFNKRISTTSFNELHQKIVSLRKSNLYPYGYNLPEAISFPSDFWDDLIKIFKMTDRDGLERAFSVFWADGEVVLTQTNTGSESSVKSGGSIQVKYSHHPTRQGYARKELFLDGKLLKRKDVYHKSVPKALEVQYLFNIHTHPKHVREDGSSYYNFFSAQDVKALISSKAIMTGLVTDRLWLLIRTDKTPLDVSDLKDSDITPEFVENVLHIGLYRADFHKKAFRTKFLED